MTANMNILGNRIQFLQNETGLSNAAVARAAGVERATVTEWKKGKTKTMSAAVAQELSKNSGFASDWLATGKGPMYSPKTAFDNEAVIYGKVPLISWVQAGGWRETIDNFQPGDAEEWLLCTDKHSNSTYALVVSGLSMYSPGDEDSYSDGEIIFVDPEREPTHKSCVVVRLPNENTATFKRLLIDGNKKYLEAINPSWPNRIIQVEEDAVFCGVVFGSYKRR